MTSKITVESLIEQAKVYPAILVTPQKCPFDQIVASISEAEEVKLAFTAIRCIAGKNQYGMVAVVFTNQRLLIAGKPKIIFGSMMQAGVKSIKLDKVNSVGVFAHRVQVNTIGDEDISFSTYSSDIGTKLAQKIQSFIDDYQTAAAPKVQTVNNIVTKSLAEELKAFKELLDMGVITQEEFDAKKKQLLGL